MRKFNQSWEENVNVKTFLQVWWAVSRWKFWFRPSRGSCFKSQKCLQIPLDYHGEPSSTYVMRGLDIDLKPGASPVTTPRIFYPHEREIVSSVTDVNGLSQWWVIRQALSNDKAGLTIGASPGSRMWVSVVDGQIIFCRGRTERKLLLLLYIFIHCNNKSLIMYNIFGVFALGNCQVHTPIKITLREPKRYPCFLLETTHQTMRILRFLALLFVLFIVFDYVGNIQFCLAPPPHPLPHSSRLSYGLYETKDVSFVERTFIDMIVFHLLILIVWLIFLQYQAWMYMCNNTFYVPFDTNLNLFKKNTNSTLPLFSCLWYSSVCFIALVLLSDYKMNFMHLFSVVMLLNSEFLYCFETIFYLLCKFKKAISMTFFVTSVILIFTTATTPNAHYVCICVLQIFCLFLQENCLLGCRPYWFWSQTT